MCVCVCVCVCVCAWCTDAYRERESSTEQRVVYHTTCNTIGSESSSGYTPYPVTRLRSLRHTVSIVSLPNNDTCRDFTYKLQLETGCACAKAERQTRMWPKSSAVLLFVVLLPPLAVCSYPWPDKVVQHKGYIEVRFAQLSMHVCVCVCVCRSTRRMESTSSTGFSRAAATRPLIRWCCG